MSKPAKRVLQGQVPQGVFFTSVELEHLKYKCLLDEQAFFFSPADRHWGAQPEGRRVGMFW